jgi:phosphoglycolate phosphatase-like HAD superfamily hydrolase
MLLYAAVKMELCLDDCIMFGDTIADKLAAKAAGVTFVKLETNGSLMETIQCL